MANNNIYLNKVLSREFRFVTNSITLFGDKFESSYGVLVYSKLSEGLICVHELNSEYKLKSDQLTSCYLIYQLSSVELEFIYNKIDIWALTWNWEELQRNPSISFEEVKADFNKDWEWDELKVNIN
jgi:hypothetical protein